MQEVAGVFGNGLWKDRVTETVGICVDENCALFAKQKFFDELIGRGIGQFLALLC